MKELLPYVLSGGCAAAVIKLIEQWLVWRLGRKAKKEDTDAEKAHQICLRHDKDIETLKSETADLKCAMMLYMQDRIDWLANTYIRRGWISVKELTRINRMHEVYHNRLNGNGDLNDVMALVHDLEVRPDAR